MPSSLAAPRRRTLLLLGVGHMAYGHGVPERIFATRPALREQTFSFYCRGTAHGLVLRQLLHGDAPSELGRLFGGSGRAA